MQNLLVIIFPLIIDALNGVGGVDSPKVKFWVSVLTSLAGGVMLNFSQVQTVASHPTLAGGVNVLTLLALIIGSTQGLYLKYWENHPARSKVFPTASGVVQTVSTPSVPDAVPAVSVEPQQDATQIAE